MIPELLRISCAAPEGHRHRDGQQMETERGAKVDGVRDAGKVVGQDKNRQQLTERDGGEDEEEKVARQERHGGRAEWRV